MVPINDKVPSFSPPNVGASGASGASGVSGCSGKFATASSLPEDPPPQAVSEAAIKAARQVLYSGAIDVLVGRFSGKYI